MSELRQEQGLRMTPQYLCSSSIDTNFDRKILSLNSKSKLIKGPKIVVQLVKFEFNQKNNWLIYFIQKQNIQKTKLYRKQSKLITVF